ncbi:MAG: phosphopantothenoylcysteine decarboxylase [Verrucomicrobiota bacterium]
MKILVTSGATREPLDDVRFLSNVSTGATGAALADALAASGHAVTLLRGTGAVAPRRVRAVHAFGSTSDLLDQLRTLVATGGFDAVIQCAAIADYKPAHVARGKMSSYAPALTVRLVPTPKLLPRIKSFAPRDGARPPLVIGFKLTSGTDAAARSAAVAKLFALGTVDAVIHNDMAELGAGRARPFRAYVAGRLRPLKLAGLPALTKWLDGFIRTARD